MKELRWRVQSNDDGGFDELVVGAPKSRDALVHAEMLDERSIFVSVGELQVWAHVDRRGKVRVTHWEPPQSSDARPASERHGEES